MKQVLKRLSLLALSLALVMAAALPCWAADTAAAPTDAPAETEEMAEMPGDGAAPEGESMPEMGPPQIELAEGDEVDLGFHVEKATMIIAIVFAVAAVAVLGLFIFRAVRIRSVRKVGSALLCVVLAALLVLNIAVARFNVVVNQFLSGQGSSDEITAAEEASKAKTQELEGEGIVLLKNEGSALPLAEKKVNVFGYGSYAPAYGGAGSGSGDETKNVSVKGGLEAAGFTVNDGLLDFYSNLKTGEYEGNVFNMMGNDFNIYEPAVSEYGDLIDSAKEFSDTAIVVISRADWEGTLPTQRTPDREASAELIAAIEDYSVPEDPDAEPIVIQDNGLILADVIGLDYDDPKWQQLLEQLSVEDMVNLITTGGYQTISIASVSKPATVDIDGPAGLNGLVNGISGVQFCSEVVMACTWNQKLVEEMGECLGDEALANGVTGLYGPGADTHRSHFGGRNFEYFSEDGLLAGKMAVAEIRGAVSRGCYTYVKHYDLNDAVREELPSDPGRGLHPVCHPRQPALPEAGADPLY